MEFNMTFISSSNPASYATHTTTHDNTININNHTNSLSNIKRDINHAINTVTENLNHGFTGDITTLEKVSQLLNHSYITENTLKVTNKQTTNNKNQYTISVDNNKLFSITIITGETRFPTATTSGDDVIINLKEGFDKLYNQLYASNNSLIDDTELANNASYIVNLT
jgi:Tfp pilus tip-associated adhesin PilY1